MNKKMRKSRSGNLLSGIVWIAILLLTFILFSCEKKFDEYYKVPEDLIGTILQVLEEDGNYTQFIKAVELVEYDDVLGVTGNFTVFAPDDNAFAEFFTEYGYNSLEDIPVEELEGIVYYHIIFWAYSKYMLLYGLGIQDVDIEYSTLNFKQPTKYLPPKTIEVDTIGRVFNVYHFPKFIPVYSDELFAELDLSATVNYSLLYPASTWGGFNVDRARVVEYDVPAQNGWIHKIDKVLVPPPNHDDILEEMGEYSIFNDLINKNTSYEFSYTYTYGQANDGDPNEDGVLDSIFLDVNDIFPPGCSPDGENVADNGHQNILSVFAPTNEAFQSFFVNHTRGYSSLYDIGKFWMNWYIRHYISTNYWPAGFSTLTEDWEWDLAKYLVDCNVTEGDIDYLKMASNGPFCGLNKYLLPQIYESVAGPIFGNSQYEWFCSALIFYMADRMLNEENLEFTLFAPTNSAMNIAGYTFRTGLGGWGIYSKFNPITPIARDVATDIIKTHIVFGQMSEDDFEAGTFIETSQHSYIGIEQNGVYAGGDLTLSHVGSPEIVSGEGVIFRIDRMLISPDLTIFDVISNPNDYPQYQKFFQLCYLADLMLLDEFQFPVSLNNIAVGSYYTAFIPTNEALEEGILNGTVPEDPDSLQQFLRYHFVETVIFPDGEKSGVFNTTRIDEESGYLFNTIEIINQKDDLKVKDNLGNIRNVILANKLAQDGVIHQIDSILLFR
jgi:uncharacterized surface protein with fasciclin (FAS1) repeats